MLAKLIELVAELEKAIALGRQGKAGKSEEMFFNLSKGIVPNDYPGLFGNSNRTNLDTAKSYVRLAALRLVKTAVEGWTVCSRCHGTGTKYDGICYTCWGVGSVCRLTGKKQRGLGNDNKEVVIKQNIQKARKLQVTGISISVINNVRNLQKAEISSVLLALWNDKIGKAFDCPSYTKDCETDAVKALTKLLTQVETPIIVIVNNCLEAKMIACNLRQTLPLGIEVALMDSGMVVQETINTHARRLNGVTVEIVEDDEREEEPYNETWVDAPELAHLTPWKTADEIFPA